MERVKFTLSVHPGPEDVGGMVLRISPFIDDPKLEQAFNSLIHDPHLSHGENVYSRRGLAERNDDSTDVSYTKLPPFFTDADLLDHGARILTNAGYNVAYAQSPNGVDGNW